MYFAGKDLQGGSYGVLIASPSAYTNNDIKGECILSCDGSWRLRYTWSKYSGMIRPVIYLPPNVTLKPSGTANLWTIDYGE